MKTKILALAVGAALVLGATGASADVITLYNTGVDAGGAVKANNQAETHYVLVAPAETYFLRTATEANGFPIPPWLGDNTSSTWIGPSTDSQLNAASGNYDYRLTFDLTGLNAATAFISGRWATDDSGLDILINGVSTGQTSNGFQAWKDFSINSGFVSGQNTIDFVLNNGGGPTGLRVELSGTASGAVPEPSTWALLIGGFGLTGVAMRRRRTAMATAA